jgi:hypothetical protein
MTGCKKIIEQVIEESSEKEQSSSSLVIKGENKMGNSGKDVEVISKAPSSANGMPFIENNGNK